MKLHFKSKSMVFGIYLLLIPLITGMDLYQQQSNVKKSDYFFSTTPISDDSSSIISNRLKQNSPNADFYDLFKDVPVVQFDTKQNSFDNGIIEQLGYYQTGGGVCRHCEQIYDGGIYEPFSDRPLVQISLEICTTATSGKILYEYYDAKGNTILAGSEQIISAWDDDGFPVILACFETEYGASIPLPKQVYQSLGQYTVSIETKNGDELFAPADWPNRGRSLGSELLLSFTIDIPDIPRFYHHDEEHKLYLLNFQGREFVNVYCFMEEVQANTFRVDSSGKLVVSNFPCDSQKKEYGVIVGSQTGIVIERGVDILIYRKLWEPFPNSCPSSRLDEGDITQVSDTSPICNRIRTRPNTTSSEIIDCVDPGTILKVVDGPQCNNGMLWWQVEVEETELKGWTAEGDDDDFWLLPGIINEPPWLAVWPKDF